MIQGAIENAGNQAIVDFVEMPDLGENHEALDVRDRDSQRSLDDFLDDMEEEFEREEARAEAERLGRLETKPR